MTIKLLAPILRGDPLANGPAEPASGRALDFRRWVLEELVVWRWEPIGWRRQRPLTRRMAQTRFESGRADTTWSDTQPEWRE